MDVEKDFKDVVGCLLVAGAVYFNFLTSLTKIAGKIKRKIRKPRRFWVNPLNTVKKRREQGDHYHLIPEMRMFDTERFVNHLRVTPKMYDKLLALVTPLIIKSSCVREPIDPGTRLEITLRYKTNAEVIKQS